MKIDKNLPSSILLTISIFFFFQPSSLNAQKKMNELSALINTLSFRMPDGPDTVNIQYSFINAGCYCSISQAISGKKQRMNSINTYSFNLKDLIDGKILISKPKDANYKDINLDIWRIEIGVFDVLIQNTNWQSQQTKTNHFYFNIEGKVVRDRVIELLKKTTEDCKGSIAEITILD